MLSSAGSEVSNGIRRSQSATSVKDRRKHPLPQQSLHPETARIHALIAAHRAMDRSRTALSDALQRTESVASKSSGYNAQPSERVRFSPASQLHRQRSTLRAKEPSLAGSLPLPGDRAPEYVSTHPYTHSALSDFGESYGAEPSSYRKLRKAKSMLTPMGGTYRPRSTISQSPFSQAPTLRHIASFSGTTEPSIGLRLKRSLNILRTGRHVPATPVSHVVVNNAAEEAVQLAKRQFLKDPNFIQVSHKSSRLFPTKTSREQKAFRKSLRNAHEGTIGYSAGSDLHNLPSAHKSQSVSVSLRNRFKRVFSKNKSGMPPQQLEATRAHFNVGSPGSSETGFDSYHAEDVSLDQRKSLYGPSNDEAETERLDQLSNIPMTSSCRDSLHSNARSRVTSWTNSTFSSATLETPLERKRLSIIKEDGGPHQPSSSAGRHIGGVSAFQQPLQNIGGNVPDSQRLYSALVKRIDQEHEEMERTQAALSQIHESKDEQRRDGLTTTPTIRAVRSQISTETIDTATRNQEPNVIQNPWQDGTDIIEHSHKQNLERRKERLRQLNTQSTFFPYSPEDQPETPSPFRAMMLERRNHTGADGKTDSQTPMHFNDLPQAHAAMKSSESIYSRTTHGGINSNYDPPIRSEEDLRWQSEENIQPTGFATIMPARYPRTNEKDAIRSRLATATSANSADRAVWKGWIENQMSSFQRRDSKASSHFREHAQISPEDTRVGESYLLTLPIKVSDVGIRNCSPKSWTAPPALSVPKKRSAQLEEHEDIASSRLTNSKVETGNVPTNLHEQNVSSSTLHKSASPNKSVNSKISSSLRKISHGNLTKILNTKAQLSMNMRTNGFGKENRPSVGGITPSPPEAGRLQIRAGNSTGRLRPKGSQMGSISAGSAPHDSSTDNESPSDRVKAKLSCRLSRPFDMDTPECNRPFDSMYLGKSEQGLSNLSSSRLSVAKQRRAKDPEIYSKTVLSSLNEPSCEEQVDTALPIIPTAESDNKRLGRKPSKVFSSGRMVSNFLKSRRKQADAKGDVDETSSHSALAPNNEQQDTCSPLFV